MRKEEIVEERLQHGYKNDPRTEAEDQCFFGFDAEAKTAKRHPGGKTKEIETVREGKQYFSKYGERMTMQEKQKIKKRGNIADHSDYLSLSLTIYIYISHI